MGIRPEDGLFGALETELKKATEPMDCNMLFDLPGVKAHASGVNRVSDYLGNLWRKGLVLRLPAPKGDNNRARWMYVWKNRPAPPKPTMDQAVAALLSKPNIEISEEDNVVTITLKDWSITIKQR